MNGKEQPNHRVLRWGPAMAASSVPYTGMTTTYWYSVARPAAHLYDVQLPVGDPRVADAQPRPAFQHAARAVVHPGAREGAGAAEGGRMGRAGVWTCATTSDTQCVSRVYARGGGCIG